MRETDRDIKDRLLDRLTWDVRVDPSEVEVEVENGALTIGGEVANYASRSAVMEAAFSVPDVREVRDHLLVRRPEGPDVIPTDAEIQQRVSDIVAWNPSFSGDEIRIKVAGGVATLQGTVNAAWKRASVVDLAASVFGVMAVRNELAVVPTEEVADRDLARDLVAAFERHVLVDATRTEVRVSDGIVTLSGRFSSPAARKAAEEIALRTPGVVEVRNRIELVQTA